MKVPVNQTFVVDKGNIRSIRVETSPVEEIQEGEILLEVVKVSFTSNNITYAILGEQFRYWDFFPHSKGGIIPAWGIGKVVETKNDDIAQGEMYYGYFPMSSYLTIQPVNINRYGLQDCASHRQELPSVYNYYEKIEAESWPSENHENAYMLFQPLFATSFLLEHYYRENGYFNSKDIFITSASSKTAIAFAFLLKQNASDITTIGITSAKNKEFCKELECYDIIHDYSQLQELNSEASSIIDFSGNRKQLLQLQNTLLKSIHKSSTVGLSHWDKGGGVDFFPTKNELFFAPLHAKNKQKEWGGKVYKLKLDAALDPFLQWSLKWMKFQFFDFDAITDTYGRVLNGEVRPDKGIILRLQGK